MDGISSLDASSLDRANAVPLYHQIFLELRDEIISGLRSLGDQAPTELALASAYGVSRITARRALDELAHQGFVERRRRTGTRITYRSPTRPIEANVEQAVDSLLAFGRDTKVRVLEVSTVPAPPDIAARLELARDVPVAPPAGWSCSDRRSENWAVCDANPSVSELAMSLPIVSRSVCIVSIPEAAVPSERTDMGCSYLWLNSVVELCG